MEPDPGGGSQFDKDVVLVQQNRIVTCGSFFIDFPEWTSESGIDAGDFPGNCYQVTGGRHYQDAAGLPFMHMGETDYGRVLVIITRLPAASIITIEAICHRRQFDEPEWNGGWRKSEPPRPL